MARTTVYAKADVMLTLEGAAAKQGRRVAEADLSIVKNASMVVEGGRIAWIGPHARLPKSYAKTAKNEVSLKGQTVLPGLIECHTHAVFAGHRAEEFELRNNGVPYREIAARGGGILSTMRATRAAKTAALADLAQGHADAFAAQGVTSLEIKSGYALNLKDELRMLEAAGRVKGPRIARTFLGAHALPPEFKTAAEYLAYLGDEVLPAVRRKKLAERVDIFVEKGFFEEAEAAAYLEKARALGFETVIHADQITLSGGSRLAVRAGSRSADHVLQVTPSEIAAFAASETTAVLLPAADLYMRCAYPPARALIDAGARVALATDFNPGTSPTRDVALVGLLARLEMKMTLPEVIAAYTVGAAHALGFHHDGGHLQVGRRADFFSTMDEWTTLFYSVGRASANLTVNEGRTIFKKR